MTDSRTYTLHYTCEGAQHTVSFGPTIVPVQFNMLVPLGNAERVASLAFCIAHKKARHREARQSMARQDREILLDRCMRVLFVVLRCC